MECDLAEPSDAVIVQSPGLLGSFGEPFNGLSLRVQHLPGIGVSWNPGECARVLVWEGSALDA